MKRSLCAILLVLILTACTSSADSSVWFPDPAPSYGAESVFLEQDILDGISYSMYECRFEASIDMLSTVVVAYTEALKELGFEVGYLQDDFAISFQSFSAEGHDGAAYMYICAIDNLEQLSKGGEGTIYISFNVPSSFEFELGRGLVSVVDGKVMCIECEGTGDCVYCLNGRASYGDGYEDCVVCDGTGQCTICGHLGYYE